MNSTGMRRAWFEWIVVLFYFSFLQLQCPYRTNSPKPFVYKGVGNRNLSPFHLIFSRFPGKGPFGCGYYLFVLVLTLLRYVGHWIHSAPA